MELQKNTIVYKINKDLLCNTMNYIQYLVTTYDGKESGKEYIYIYIYTHVCITESLCHIPENNIIL